jgi:hypothetical protein
MARLPKQRTNEQPQPCIEALRASRPDVAITVSRTIDSHFCWDGDGPDPYSEGYDPYDVTVRASVIRNGRLIEGESTLGGSYFRRDEPFNEIRGYLPQMVEEATEEMDAEVKRLDS